MYEGGIINGLLLKGLLPILLILIQEKILKQNIMKKITLGLAAVALSLTFIPQQSIAANPTITNVGVTPAEQAKADAILLRLTEIKNLDKTNLTSSEKKTLRKEVKSLKKELKEKSQGVYLSVGAIIIIILLLILIL